MNDPLLARQVGKRLGLPAGRLDRCTAEELSQLLRAAPAEALAAVLTDVDDGYAEAAASHRRVSHALRVGSGELYEANCRLNRRAAEAEALYEVALAARDGAELGELIEVCLRAMSGVLRCPLAMAWVDGTAGRPDGDGWLMDPAAMAALSPGGRAALARFRGRIGGCEGRDPFGLRQAVVDRRAPVWIEELVGLGVDIDPCDSAALDGVPRSAIALPILVYGRVVAVLAFFSFAPLTPDRDGMDLTTRLAFHASQVMSQRETERQRATQLGMLHATLESTLHGVLALDAKGRVLVANDRFLQMGAVAGGKHDVGQREGSALQVFGRLAEGPPSHSGRLCRDLPPGTVESGELILEDGRSLEWYTQPMQAGAVAAGRIWTFFDVTAARVAERERRGLEAQLLQAQKMEAVGRLAGGVAHDFNNLLTAILGYAEILASSFGRDDPRLRSLMEIQGAAQRAAGLTRQLLAFSRKQVLAPVLLDLNSTVAGMASLLHRLIGEDIRLHTVLGADLGTVRADPAQVEQVILNLAVNARDAMPSGGDLTIGTRREAAGPANAAAGGGGDMVVLTVRDTGTGMTDEVQRRAFEPFFTTKDPGKGTGLGLSTVHGIVAQSGGLVRVESEPGRGTVFHVAFPRVVGALPPAPEPCEAPAVAPAAATILLVEDDAVVRALVQHVLTTAGYQVLSTAGPAEALTLARACSSPPDLLLTDVVMPDKSGPKLYRELSAIWPELHVLFVSGYLADAPGLEELGPDLPLLQKPFRARELVLAVAQALARAERPEPVGV